MLAIVTPAPLTAASDVGANVTVNRTDCPGVKVMPLESPLAVNPAPVVVTLEIVTLEFPVFLTDVVSELVLPAAKLPKERLVGLAPSDRVGADPDPERPITSDEGVPFVARVILPLAGAEEAGVKAALNVRLPPAAIELAVERPVSLKPVPETDT